MVAKRLNLCGPVRNALAACGISTVAVVEAINAVLAQAVLLKAGDLKDGRERKATKKRDAEYSVSEGGSKWALPVSVVTRFDVWAGKVKAASDYAYFPSVAIPDEFNEWLEKFESHQPTQAEPQHQEHFAQSGE